MKTIKVPSNVATALRLRVEAIDYKKLNGDLYDMLMEFAIRLENEYGEMSTNIRKPIQGLTDAKAKGMFANMNKHLTAAASILNDLIEHVEDL